ncbi:MAG: hypothetical protein MUD13_05175 [Candidatus Nanopelagicales bacterium]|nr:hypothetical protein [Candidatus Nanopelagicales bacterium]
MAKKRAHRPEGYPSPPTQSRPAAAAPRPSGPPTGAGGRSAAPRSDARVRFEELSAPVLVRMQLLPAWLVPVLLGIMLFVGLAVRAPWAGSLLVLIGLFLTWLTAVSWPVVSPGSRALRVLVNVAVLGMGVAKLVGAI